jgi:hypothetical protein
MCKEMPVIPGNRAVDKKRIIGKNEGPRRRRDTKGHFLDTFTLRRKSFVSGP